MAVSVTQTEGLKVRGVIRGRLSHRKGGVIKFSGIARYEIRIVAEIIL